MARKIEFSDAEWREKLSDEQYEICRKKGTEPPFTGLYTDCKKEGVYHCACCGEALFSSETKYDSGSGWPSFWNVVDQSNVETTRDRSFGMQRVEVTCASCGAHLGHLFEDGPQPTNLRYCINSASLDLKEQS